MSDGSEPSYEIIVPDDASDETIVALLTAIAENHGAGHDS